MLDEAKVFCGRKTYRKKTFQDKKIHAWAATFVDCQFEHCVIYPSESLFKDCTCEDVAFWECRNVQIINGELRDCSFHGYVASLLYSPTRVRNVAVFACPIFDTTWRMGCEVTPQFSPKSLGYIMAHLLHVSREEVGDLADALESFKLLVGPAFDSYKNGIKEYKEHCDD